MDNTMLPVVLEGRVVHGFGRGRRQLGIPTANLDKASVAAQLPKDFRFGVYYGWAQISGWPELTVTDAHRRHYQQKKPGNDERVVEMVASVGFNPFYRNTAVTVEVHLLREFHTPFYGATLKVLLSGFLRDERDFPSEELLIDAIRQDIATARHHLDGDAEQKRLRELYFDSNFDHPEQDLKARQQQQQPQQQSQRQQHQIKTVQ